MTAAEKGILMLCCRLGDEDAVTMTPKQFHGLRRRLHNWAQPTDSGELTAEFLCGLGLPAAAAERILGLLDRQSRLDRYLEAAEQLGIHVVTRLSPVYPGVLEQRLGQSAPPVLFFKGDMRLLEGPWVSLVGSRKLEKHGRMVAERIGSLAFREGYVLVSGGAHGADQTAQRASLDRGGRILVFTPERLTEQPEEERVLYCSEDGFEVEFSPARALNRNRLIHALGEKTFVAQCGFERGGTWRGSIENLKNGYSPLYVMSDGSAGMEGLLRAGAREVFELESIHDLREDQLSFTHD